jgi:carboxyl-terminal processing protease
MFSEWDGADLLQDYLEALTHAYDPQSDYFNTEHAQDFSIEMSLSLFGIGAQLVDRDGYCTIASLVSGGPAAKSKLLKENDRILAVAQGNKPAVDVVDMELGKVVQLIRGPKNTEVRLTISSDDDPGAHHVVSLIRAEIKLEDSEAKAQLIELPGHHGGTNRIGVVDLPSFYATVDLPGSSVHSIEKSTTADVSRLIKKLEKEKVDGIIIDLRNNGGGSLEEAIKFVGLFIKDGPVVLVRAPDGRVAVDDDDDPSVLYSGPLVVLVNRFSASAAEIAAAALQDYGRALIVGDSSTHGKGTVQSLNPLRPFFMQENESATNDPGTVKITIRKFYRVTGASTQLKGVTPDIVLPDKLSYSTEIGETALENALPWDTIPSVPYDKLNLVEPYVATLREESNERIATNQDFIDIRQDIDEFKKLQADKTAVLNEGEQIQERRSHQNLLDAHEQERQAQKPLNEKDYDITVENANEPGLPPQETNTVAATSPSGIETNLASSTTQKSPPVIGNDTIEFQRAEAARLDETENILEDNISLLNANHTLIAK